MLNANRISYSPFLNYNLMNFAVKNSEQTSFSKKSNDEETATTWKFDEEGNLVYYTYKVKTGEIVSIIKYKNPNSIKPYI